MILMLAGCGVFIADRYRFSCGLDDRDLLAYEASFAEKFPGYEFDMSMDGCGDGSSKGFRVKVPDVSAHPSAEQFVRAGCVDAGADGLGEVMYVCRDGQLRYELILEEQFVYVSPLAPA